MPTRQAQGARTLASGGDDRGEFLGYAACSRGRGRVAEYEESSHAWRAWRRGRIAVPSQ